MRARSARSVARLIAMAAVLVVAASGCGSSGNHSSGGSAGDAGLGDGAPPDGALPDSTLPPDGPDAAGMDARADAASDGAAGDATANDGSSSGDSAPDASCKPQLIVLAQAGTTSSCSFQVPASVDHNLVNVLMGSELCQKGSNNCQGGWFWFANQVALCDDTCLAWSNSGATLYLEVGCPSKSCYVACSKAGGPCDNGINHCCAGTRCENGSCATCAQGGQSCSSSGDCCSGSCQGGSCIDGIGGLCVSNAGCSVGVCRNGVCGCDTGQILCNSGCVSITDPNNCHGCGNVCASGLICTTTGCACDPSKGLPDLCNGVCVDKSSDRNNCGYCSYTCPRLDQVCINSKCQCPAGQTDCNGSCVDTNTSQTNCGGCNQACVTGREVCQGGSCVCASGYTNCSGACVDLLTDKYNCGSCGHACPGNKLCVNGAC